MPGSSVRVEEQLQSTGDGLAEVGDAVGPQVDLPDVVARLRGEALANFGIGDGEEVLQQDAAKKTYVFPACARQVIGALALPVSSGPRRNGSARG